MEKVCKTKGLQDVLDKKNYVAKDRRNPENQWMVKKNGVAIETQLENRLRKIEAMLKRGVDYWIKVHKCNCFLWLGS